MTRTLEQQLADAFCSNGQCGGDQTSAPCEHARMLAAIAMDAIRTDRAAVCARNIAAAIREKAKE